MKSEMQQDIGHRPLQATLGGIREQGGIRGRLEREKKRVGQGGGVWEWRELRKELGALDLGEGHHPRGLG